MKIGKVEIGQQRAALFGGLKPVYGPSRTATAGGAPPSPPPLSPRHTQSPGKEGVMSTRVHIFASETRLKHIVVSR